jgi:Protein of unknown function (DUF3072)
LTILRRPPANPAKNPDAAEYGNTSKDPADWVTGDEPMTGAQASYLQTLCEEVGERFDPHMTKAAASELIGQLKARNPRTSSGSPAGSEPRHDDVRSAGRSEMDLPPKSWTKTDEEIDESFPASEPPGNY